jgi:hypothetical protein
MADVFISYKRAERTRVQRLAQLLRDENLDVWFDARLEVGSGEGFDAEIEREVTSAACVVVCWTREALKSVYVRAEALKGLERDVLRPAFLEPCNLPVPFNAVDTVDLSTWNGDANSADWRRLLSGVQARVEASKADEKQRRAQSQAVYDRIQDKIYPGTLPVLVQRIASIRERDAEEYQADILALLSWVQAVAEKEARHTSQGYELADRQQGGDAWMWWDRGAAAARSAEISQVLESLHGIEAALNASKDLLDRPAP